MLQVTRDDRVKAKRFEKEIKEHIDKQIGPNKIKVVVDPELAVELRRLKESKGKRDEAKTVHRRREVSSY